MTFQKSILLLLSILLCYSNQILAQTKHVDDEALECYLKDKTKLESCLLQSWNRILALMKTGDPRLKIPKAEPLVFDTIIWNEKSASLDIQSVLRNFSIWGFANAKLTSLTVDKNARTVLFNISVPNVRILCDFSAKGTVILLPFQGEGKLAINGSNVVVHVAANIVQHGPGAKAKDVKSRFHMKIDVFKVIQSDSNDPLWEATSKIVTDNSDLLLENVQPIFGEKFSAISLGITNEVYKKFPADAFIA
ncbi:hypothetical protein CHUAL_009849 [Chamberlinius hualienensis]